MSATAAVIVADALTKSYGRSRGVVDLSFEVGAGEVFGFLGPNGAGKTTTIRTLMDFIRPTSGRVTVLGMDPRREAVAIHRRVGYLPGEFRTYPRMTGRDYLRHLAALRGGVDAETIEVLAERLGSDLDVTIASLSHGNEQKLGLIQAFMHAPDLLILDEPTQGLDPLVQQAFHTLVFEARDRGATVLFSSHVLPEVQRVCDRVGVIKEGRLVAIEDVGTLTSRSVRTIEVHFSAPVPRAAFEGLPGVRDLEVHGDVVRCTVEGPVDALVKAAARFEALDIESHEPSLEDLFLAYYRDPGATP